MSAEIHMTVADRIEQLMNHLGIEKAHFAGRSLQDWQDLARQDPGRLLSLTLITPRSVNIEAVNKLNGRILVVNGDQGPHAQHIDTLGKQSSAFELVTLPDCSTLGFTDTIADHKEILERTLIRFLDENLPPSSSHVQYEGARQGVIAGISYKMLGKGPPLFLLPLSLAPSQWEPSLAALSSKYCTIVLGGDQLGFAAIMELRGQIPGYVRNVKNLVDEMAIQPTHSILEVGPGTGVLSRWLAKYTDKKNPITGLEINAFLASEATELAARAQLSDVVTIREGNAEAMPFPDNHFDATFSVTVMEEVDAEKMMAEMVRVTKPGGRVGVIVRARDLPTIINLPLPPELKEKASRIKFGRAPKGCADATLYQLFVQAGLTNVTKFPQHVNFESSAILVLLENDLFFTGLDSSEQQVWQQAKAVAGESYFTAHPYHCAVGTKSI